MMDWLKTQNTANMLRSYEGMTITSESVNGRYIRAENDVSLERVLIHRISVKGMLIVFSLVKDGEPLAALNTLNTGEWRVGAPSDITRVFLGIRTIKLCFDDKQNFGSFKVVSHAEMKRRLAELGPDILSPPSVWASIMIPDLHSRISRFGKKMSVVEGLFDTRIIAACSVEIVQIALQTANIDPTRAMGSLSFYEIHKLFGALHEAAKDLTMEVA